LRDRSGKLKHWQHLVKAETYPLVSVIIPTYNRAHLLQKAVASVLAQDYPALEIVVVDDGSTDDTITLLEQMNDPRIQVIKHSHCGMPALLRNTGVEQCGGEWIAFLDSDDEWLPGKITSQLKRLAQTKTSWCYGRYRLLKETGEEFLPVKTLPPVKEGWITEDILGSHVSAYVGTWLLKKKLFHSLGGFDTQFRFREDLELALRLSMETNASAVDKILMDVRVHENRRTQALTNPHEQTAAVFRHFAKMNIAPSLRRIALQKAAMLLSEAAFYPSGKKMGERLKLLGKSFAHDNTRHWFSSLWKLVTKPATAPD
jgi:glycosyltransferase involved in cell wall biosynthesis